MSSDRFLNAALFERAAHIPPGLQPHWTLLRQRKKNTATCGPRCCFPRFASGEKIKNVLNLLVSFYSALKIQLRVKWLHSRSNQPQQKSHWNEDVRHFSRRSGVSAITRATGSFPCAISGMTVSSVPAWGCDREAGKLQLRSEIFAWLGKISSSSAHNCTALIFLPVVSPVSAPRIAPVPSGLVFTK